MTTLGVVWTPPRASFNGVHDQVKSKVLIILYLRWKQDIKKGLCCRELAEQSGEKLSTIKRKVYAWAKWELVRQKPGRVGTRCVALYYILPKGMHYVIYVIPPEIYSKYLNEIREHQRRMINVH